MKKALILYNSKTGTTKRFALEIAEFLKKKNLDTTVASIFEFESNDTGDFEYVLLGCWTSGLMILLQRPERVWVEFSEQLPDLGGKKIGLFTTYTIATGSMFKQMRKHVQCNPNDIAMELKSRNGELIEPIRKRLLEFIL